MGSGSWSGSGLTPIGGGAREPLPRSGRRKGGLPEEAVWEEPPSEAAEASMMASLKPLLLARLAREPAAAAVAVSKPWRTVRPSWSHCRMSSARQWLVRWGLEVAAEM